MSSIKNVGVLIDTIGYIITLPWVPTANLPSGGMFRWCTRDGGIWNTKKAGLLFWLLEYRRNFVRFFGEDEK